MRTTSKTGVQIFIQECVKHGMTTVVCSPGSRNAPIIIALDEHPAIKTYVIHDERSAAFYALGMAQQLNKPVGVVCTSGSAMLNYYPAVAEAFYQEVPLVVMSADRPEEWVNHGDGQTIVQAGVYTNHIRYERQVSEFIDDSEKGEFINQIKEGFKKGNGSWKGPVHFNFPFSEPLYDTVDVEDINEDSYAYIDSRGELALELKEELGEVWKSRSKKMILVGQMDKSESFLNSLALLAEDPSVVVLVENTSNLVHPKFIHCIDRTLTRINKESIAEFQPELLVTFGGAVISKRIKKFLRESDIKSHWRIASSFPEMDTYRKLTNHIECTPTLFVDYLNGLDKEVLESTFGPKWKQKDYEFQNEMSSFMDTVDYCDLSVIERILDYVPENAVLHMGNSSIVRYCQLFDPIKSITYYSNRGTSGIDGSVSTACGAAIASPDKLHVLISGDVSFLYDSNALWNNYLPNNLRIVVVNNGGGGIFRIIDGPNQSSQLEKYFEAHHSFSVEYICKAFDVNYLNAQSLIDIDEVMVEFYGEMDRPVLLEIHTPRTSNDKILKQFFQLGNKT